MLHKKDFVQIGVIGRTHGIQGEVSMKLSVDLSGILEDGDRIFLMLEEEGLLIPYAIESHRSRSGEIDLIRLSGINSLEEAEHLVGKTVWLDNDYLEEDELSEDPYDWSRYIGFEVYDAETETSVGRVVEVDERTLNVLLLVETPMGEELTLPIAEELLVGISDEDRVCVLRIPRGLLDESLMESEDD